MHHARHLPGRIETPAVVTDPQHDRVDSTALSWPQGARVPDEQIRMTRSRIPDAAQLRPVMLAVGGDSASGQTTLATGLVDSIGPDRCTAVCVDDYHRVDRAERKELAFTPLHPDCNYVDIVVRFAPVPSRNDPPGSPLSAELLLRPTIQHPPLSHILTDDHRTATHLKIIRDNDGAPVDCLHVHSHANHDEIQMLQKEIWAGVADTREMPEGLGSVGPGERSEPLAMTQPLLLYHLMQEVYQA
jgi:hypothetical protein